MADDLSSQISSAASAPKRMKEGQREVEAHSPKDLIAADEYLQKKDAAAVKKPWKYLFRAKNKPPGAQ